jgi:hypothetical protein
MPMPISGRPQDSPNCIGMLTDTAIDVAEPLKKGRIVWAMRYPSATVAGAINRETRESRSRWALKKEPVICGGHQV